MLSQRIADERLAGVGLGIGLQGGAGVEVVGLVDNLYAALRCVSVCVK